MTSNIVVIGSSNIDLVMKMERLPKRFETVTDAEFIQTFGGKGANQAVGAARAGGNVSLIACLGDDRFAPQVIENLESAGVHSDFIFTEQGIACGAALIMVGTSGDNYISVAPGANYRLGEAHIEHARKIIAAADIIMLQFEILPDTLYYALDTAALLGKTVLFNLAPARPFDQACLHKVNLLVVNEVEAEFLCGFPVDSIEVASRAAEALIAKGPHIVVITLGVGGSYVAAPGLRQAVPAFPVQAVDSTAAGDIYCACLAVALTEGKSILEAVRFASAASAISVTRLGAQPSAPTRVEIEEFLFARK
jgi:ribokinase